MAGIAADRLGVCSWSLRPQSPSHLVTQLETTGIARTQLALHPICNAPNIWADAAGVLSDANIEVVSGMFGTFGEDYASLDTIRQTGGVVPDEHWERNFELAGCVAGVAASMGLARVSFHAGFIPHDPGDPNYAKLSDRVRRIADRFAAHDITLLLETGQETAQSLLAFLEALQQPNVAVNFDPANMILYGMGDPVASLKALAGHVRQVHVKDALRAATPGQWGEEVVVGQGEVDWPAFLKAMDEVADGCDLVIEREAGNDRVADVREAVRVVMQAG